MEYRIYLAIGIFFIYSVLGWIIEELFAAFRYGRFINRGFLNGPICPVYGISMYIVLNVLSDFGMHPIWQIIGAVGIVTLIEYVTGALMFKVTGRRLWDYRDMPYNLNGYICFTYSLMWGIMAVIAMWLFQPPIYIFLHLIPRGVFRALVWGMGIVFIMDFVVTMAASLKIKFKGGPVTEVANRVGDVRRNAGKQIFDMVQHRMYTSFPELKNQEPSEERGFGWVREKTFATGMCLEKLIWMFLVSGFVGDFVETVYMLMTTGRIMSRSSLLYIPFSLVWGMGGALITGVLYTLKERNNFYIFLGGFFFGGVFEYTCSALTELVFGTIFWDYSHIPFNLNGRINLLFCVVWGFLAIFWVKVLYPAVSRQIEKIPPVSGMVLSYIMMFIMILAVLISALALGRYVQRKRYPVQQEVIGEFLDKQYPDSMIEKVYLYMKIVK